VRGGDGVRRGHEVGSRRHRQRRDAGVVEGVPARGGDDEQRRDLERAFVGAGGGGADARRREGEESAGEQ
jgi:hypothetical protein